MPRLQQSFYKLWKTEPVCRSATRDEDQDRHKDGKKAFQVTCKSDYESWND